MTKPKFGERVSDAVAAMVEWIEDHPRATIGLLTCGGMLVSEGVIRGRYDLLAAGLLGLLAVGMLLVWLGKAIDTWIFGENPAPQGEELPSPICPKCGYDLRASLMQCPECGAETPFKQWLDKQHPLERYMFEKELAKHPHQAEPDADVQPQCKEK